MIYGRIIMSTLRHLPKSAASNKLNSVQSLVTQMTSSTLLRNHSKYDPTNNKDMTERFRIIPYSIDKNRVKTYILTPGT